MTKTRFSTVAEVAAALRVSKMTVYRLVEDESLPAFRVGRLIRIPTQAVWDFLGGAQIRTDQPDLGYAKSLTA